MNDNEKTKEQLISELADARKRITDLESTLENPHEAILPARSLAFDISSHFLKSKWEDFEKDVIKGLEKIGRFADIDRAMLIMLKDNRQSYKSSYIWRAPGFNTPTVEGLDLDDITNKLYNEIVSNEDIMIFEDIDQISEENVALKKYIKYLGLRSVISFALRFDGILYGLIGFGVIREKREWADNDVYTLKLLGDVFLNAILRFRAYRENEENVKRYKYLYNKSSTLNMVIGPDFRIRDVNDPFVKNALYEKSEIIGKSIFDFIMPYDHEKAKNSVKMDYDGIETPASDIDFRDKNGDIRTLLFSPGSVPIIENDEITGMLVSSIDITDLKKYQRSLKLSEEKYRTLFDLSPAMTIISRLNDGKIIEANKAFLNSTGYTYEEISGKTTVEKDLIDIEIRRQYKKELEEAGIVKNFEFNFTDKSGNRQTGLISSEKINIDGQQYVLSVGINITNRKAREEEREKLIKELREYKSRIEANIKELERLNRELTDSESILKNTIDEKDKFFGIIAHDLRGPFSGFINLTETLTKDFSKLSLKEIHSYSNALYNSASGLYRLLENLLEWSRLQRGVIPYRPFNLCLKMVVDSAVLVETNNAGRKSISMKNDIPEDMYVFADEVMLETVFRNLLSNAVKFTKKGGFVSIEALDKGDNITITVADNGIGMDEKAIGKIFAIDRHYTTVGTANERGTGLGLILCKEFIEKNKGSISVQSSPGKGTAFAIDLPKGKKQEVVI